jgi:hypothetical protein
MVHRERECKLLTHVHAILINDCETIGVGVLAETDVRVRLANLGQHGSQILSRWLRGVCEEPIGVAAQDRHFAP